MSPIISLTSDNHVIGIIYIKSKAYFLGMISLMTFLKELILQLLN